MIIFLFLTALIAGVSAAVLLWPLGPALALLAAPFVASAVVLIAAVVLVRRSAEAREDRGMAGNFLYALTKLLTR